jgi:predicted phosphodiesterase
MALYGIVSDIHGNLEALAAAVTFLQERGVERILCLGDIVGYNADPDACVSAVLGLGMESVAGNHDVIATGAMGLARCSDKAAHALKRTRRTLSGASRKALAALPLRRIVDDELVLFHGGFLDVCEYMTTEGRIEKNEAHVRRRHPRARICFFGHTHVQRLYEVHRGVANARPPEGRIALDGRGRIYFVNPGSVDAARRSGERTAELAVLDASRGAISFHDVPYDHGRAEQRAVEEGYRMSWVDERLHGAAATFRRCAGRVQAALRLPA